MLTPRQKIIYETLDQFWMIHEGKKLPTYEEVSNCLAENGHSRGSPNEFYRYRPRWKEERGYADPKTQIEPLPDPLAQATNALRQKILEEAEQKIAASQTNYENKIADLIAKIQQLTQQLQTSTDDHEILKNKFEKQTQEFIDLKKQCELTTELHNQTTVDLEKARSELKATQSESEKWQTISQQTHQDLRNDHKEHIEKLTTSFDKAIDHYKQELSTTREFMESQRHDFSVQNTNLKAEVTKLQENINKSQQEKETLKIETKELANKNQQLDKIVNDKDIEIDILRKKMDKSAWIEEQYQKILVPIEEKITHVSQQQLKFQTDISSVFAEVHAINDKFSQLGEQNGK